MNTIQFSHANGFPAKTYSYLFELIDFAEITYVNRIGHGKFQLNNDLNNLADELIQDMENKHDKPVIGIGHSIGGAITMLAALKKPELFRQLILMDPILFSPRARYFVWALRKLGLGDFVGPIKKTLKRKSEFSSIEESRKLNTKPLFENFHQKCFDAYIEHGFNLTNDGLELAFRPEVEVSIYRNFLLHIPKEAYQLEATFIYGDKSDVINKSDVAWWKKKFLNCRVEPFSGGHLFPFEHPAETAQLIRDLIY